MGIIARINDWLCYDIALHKYIYWKTGFNLNDRAQSIKLNILNYFVLTIFLDVNVV